MCFCQRCLMLVRSKAFGRAARKSRANQSKHQMVFMKVSRPLPSARFGNLAYIRFTFDSTAAQAKGDRFPAIAITLR